VTTVLVQLFTDTGTPTPGLDARITIKNITDDVVVVNSAAMTDRGDGFYYYPFTGKPSKVYTVLFDGGSTLIAAERYAWATLPGILVNQGGLV